MLSPSVSYLIIQHSSQLNVDLSVAELFSSICYMLFCVLQNVILCDSFSRLVPVGACAY